MKVKEEEFSIFERLTLYARDRNKKKGPAILDKFTFFRRIVLFSHHFCLLCVVSDLISISLTNVINPLPLFQNK